MTLIRSRCDDSRMDDKSGMDAPPSSQPLELVYTPTFDAAQWHVVGCWKIQRERILYRTFVYSIMEWPVAHGTKHHCVTDAVKALLQ